MLDADDEQLIKEAKDGAAILVTWDRVLRTATGGITPYELLLEMGKQSGKGTPGAQAEIPRLRQVKTGELTVMAESANNTYQYFQESILVNMKTAKLIRKLRVEKNLSWRAVARFGSKLWGGNWGSNQLAGMVVCNKAAKLLGEDFMEPPWN